MAFKTPWPPVYPGISSLPDKDVARITVNFSESHRRAIMSVALNPAIFSLICQKALAETAETIIKHDLDYGNSTELIQWICKRTFAPAFNQTNASDDTGGEKGVCDPTPQRQVAAARIGEVVETKRRGKGTKGKGGE